MVEAKLVDTLIQGFPEYSDIRRILLDHKKDGHGHCLAIFDDAREGLNKLGRGHSKTMWTIRGR